MKFLECITLNPKISLEKGKIYSFIEMSNIGTNYRNPTAIEKKPFDSGVKFQDGDTIIARITPCFQNGKRFYCRGIGIGFGSTEFLVFRPKDESVDNLYLYYFMKTDFMNQCMINSMTGSTGRQRVNNEIFKDIEVNFPNIEIQKKIGGILSVYDDLIENNQKQIKLLEEAAQRLYKEWFVDLYFPGYENMKVVDGVPEGWKKRKVTDFLEVKYGKDHKALEDGDIPAYGSGGVIRKVKSILYSGESILIPRKGSLNNIMYVTGDFWTIDTMFFSKPRMDNILKYTYLFLKRLDMYSFNIGAAVPSMTVKILDGIDILQPDEKTLVEFEKVMNPIFCKIEILGTQIEKMQETRDRLLPKLINGEIEV